MQNLIVPSSMQRIRAFLIEMCGMKVKPWASTEQALAALHATLVSLRGRDMFWTSLRVLLERLASDLKTRREAEPGSLLDNEVLDGERYAALLDEIRAALARQSAEASNASFRRLASALSASALGLLLLLGGAASFGCSDSPLRGTTTHPDAATPDAITSPSERPVVTIALPDAPPEVVTTSPDGPPVINLAVPDTRSPFDAVVAGPDGGTVTITDIMESCSLDAQLQASVLACLARMRSSWSEGLAALYAGATCRDVAFDLSCFAYGETCALGAGVDTEFDPATSMICRPVIIYAGVRFV